jgi:hypothetical protein
MPKYIGNVRYWLNSGKHMLAASFSGWTQGGQSQALTLSETGVVSLFLCWQVDFSASYSFSGADYG